MWLFYRHPLRRGRWSKQGSYLSGCRKEQARPRQEAQTLYAKTDWLSAWAARGGGGESRLRSGGASAGACLHAM